MTELQAFTVGNANTRIEVLAASHEEAVIQGLIGDNSARLDLATPFEWDCYSELVNEETNERTYWIVP